MHHLRKYIRNKEVRRRTRVQCITEVIKKSKLRWFGHLARRGDEESIKRIWRTPVEARKSRGDK